MDSSSVLDGVSNLSDLELAVMLSLTAEQHCLITTEQSSLDDLATELSLIVSEIFGLSCSIVEAEQQQSVEEFGAAILNENLNEGFAAEGGSNDGKRLAGGTSVRTASHAGNSELDSRMVVNVIIAKQFNFAHRNVQIATLELIQRRRIFSRTTVHPVPKNFLFIPLVAVSTTQTQTQRLNYHLNDRIFISHHHAAQDGFANLEELDQRSLLPEHRALGSNEHLTSGSSTSQQPKFTLETIEQIRKIGRAVTMTTEIRRYLQDIICFLRMERGVDGGVSPFATTMCVELSKMLAALHGITYVTPSLVALAVRKVYAHRIVLATPDRDRSLQWGSNIGGAQEALRGLTAERIIDNVLAGVQCPV